MQTCQVARPIRLVPIAGDRRPGDVHRPDARIEHGIDCGVGVRGRAAVVRIVDHRRDAGIDATQRRNHVADVDLTRSVVFGKRQVGGIAVVPKRCRIGVGAAQLAFPAMAMGIHHAWNSDHLRGVDHFGTTRVQLRADGGNGAIGNQDVALGQVADIGIHADDRGASNQNFARGWCQRLHQLRAQIGGFCVRAGRNGSSQVCGRSQGKCGTARDKEAHIVLMIG